MEHIAGVSFHQILASGAPSGLEQRHQCDRPGATLDYAPENGILHRDIKPANLLVTERLGTISCGKERPVCTNSTNDCIRRNRRAAITASEWTRAQSPAVRAPLPDLILNHNRQHQAHQK